LLIKVVSGSRYKSLLDEEEVIEFKYLLDDEEVFGGRNEDDQFAVGKCSVLIREANVQFMLNS
jgi:hypothetical protein